MSSFLYAAENVAWQRQNVRRDLQKEKKKMEEEGRTVDLALEGHNVCYFWSERHRKIKCLLQ